MSSDKKNSKEALSHPQPADAPAAPPPASPQGDSLFAILLTVAFGLIVLFGLLHHEMWRDELQAWMVVTDAHSLGGLLDNMRYEGNPVLWHFFLFLITRFTHDPVYMQALHALFACGFIYVFARYATLSRLHKVLFAFSYFALYEYSVISRCYGLALFCIFTICALYRNRLNNYIALGVVIALLANVTTYGILVSGCFAGLLLCDYLYFGKKDVSKQKAFAGGLAIAAIGILLSIVQVLPEKDNTFPMMTADTLFDGYRWGSALSKIFSVYFYIPKLDGIQFWNNNVYTDNIPGVEYPLIDWLFAHAQYLLFWYLLPVATFIVAVMIFLRKPFALLFFTTTSLVLLSFYYYTGLEFNRYCGFLFIILVAGYWLAEYYPEKIYPGKRLARISAAGKKIQLPFLTLVLAVNVAGASVAYYKDFRYKFTPSHDVAVYIRENKLDTGLITGIPFYSVSPLAAYLDKKIFYLQTNSFGSYCIYKGQINWDMQVQDVHRKAIELMRDGRKSLLIVSGIEWLVAPPGSTQMQKASHGDIGEGCRFDLIRSFDAGIQYDEQYYLYLVHR